MEAARAAVGAPAEAACAWRLVTRLDAGRPPYLLVGVSAGDGGWVVAVSLDGQVRGFASDPAGAQAWWTSVPEELVWAPGSWSRSPLYPLRRRGEGDDAALLDPEGHRIPGMPPGRG